MSRRDGIGLAAVALCVAGVVAFRQAYVEPREWGAICAGVAAPFACAPRRALLWMQHWQVWGGSALLLGLLAFLGAPFAVGVAAVAVGIAAVLDYNATWGMLGAALGAWAWITRTPPPGRAGRA